MTGKTLDCFHHLLVQTGEDGRRFQALGVEDQKISVTGNLKFDGQWPENLAREAMAFRARYWPKRSILLAASTHEGEEAVLLKVYQKLRHGFPDVLLILAPRHPDRIPQVARLCREAGNRVVLRSGPDQPGDEDIFLLDTLGELKFFYSLSDLAFVGGSLVPVGGHNVLEPARAGVPVLFGPYMTNAPDIAKGLEQAGAGMRTDDGEGLYREVHRLLGDAETRRAMGQKGRRFLRQNQGALQRTLVLLKPILSAAQG